jgi:transcriptional regulator with XRE-family HTH domain
VAEGSPTVRRRELGALLRRLREEQGLTVKQVTEHLLCSPSKVSRIETGQRGATLRDVRDLCDLFGVTDPAERDRLMTLAKEGKQQGWWQFYGLPYSSYVGFEDEATSVRTYEPSVIPGLLQTPDYVRGLHQDPMPEPSSEELTAEVIEKRIEERLRRQRRLFEADSSPLELWAVLEEAVLHRPVGNSHIMAAQLRRIVNDIERPNITVQILPYSVGAHPALNSTFSILNFLGAAPDIVYSEGLAGRFFIGDPTDVDRYKYVFDHLCKRALSPEESVGFLEKMIATHDSALVR